MESCAAISSSYFSLEGQMRLPRPEKPLAHRAAKKLLSSTPLCTLFLPTLNCLTAVFSHCTSLFLEGDLLLPNTSPWGGSNSLPSPVKYAGFLTPLLVAAFSIPSQTTLFLKL